MLYRVTYKQCSDLSGWLPLLFTYKFVWPSMCELDNASYNKYHLSDIRLKIRDACLFSITAGKFWN